MVRVNHLRNCLLCHPPSFDFDDKLRARVPPLDEPVAPSSSPEYYRQAAGPFVRGDITYLRQDFSLMLPVARPGPWPAEQRFDFVVRERLATARDIERALLRRRAGTSEYHRAIRFALRELAGRALVRR